MNENEIYVDGTWQELTNTGDNNNKKRKNAIFPVNERKKKPNTKGPHRQRQMTPHLQCAKSEWIFSIRIGVCSFIVIWINSSGSQCITYHIHQILHKRHIDLTMSNKTKQKTGRLGDRQTHMHCEHREQKHYPKPYPMAKCLMENRFMIIVFHFLFFFCGMHCICCCCCWRFVVMILLRLLLFRTDVVRIAVFGVHWCHRVTNKDNFRWLFFPDHKKLRRAVVGEELSRAPKERMK